MFDSVNHPAHYGGEYNPYETIKVIEAWSLDKDFYLGNTVKYISRAGKKADNDRVQDLKKAAFYLQRRIAQLEKAEKTEKVQQECAAATALASSPSLSGSSDFSVKLPVTEK